MARFLLYKDPRQAIRKHVDKNDRKQYKYIDKLADIDRIDKQTVFINEAGMYDLLLTSRLDEAKKFKKWLTHEVVPAIKKFGAYNISIEMQETIDKLRNRINILEKNQIKEKYPDGGILYAMQPDPDEDFIKIGISDFMNDRIETYATSFPDKPNIIYWKPLNNPAQIEKCIGSVLYNYRYRGKKEYYKCKSKIALRAIEKCIEFISSMNDKTSRMISNDMFKNLDSEKEYIFQFEFDIGQKGGKINESTKYYDKYVENKNAYLKLLQIE